MAITTNYNVLIGYEVKNKATKQVSKLTQATTRLATRTEKARFSLGLLGKGFLALGGIFAVKRGIEAVVGVNRELQDTQAQIRSILQLNLGGSFAENTERAGVLLSQFRKDAAQTPGTFKDLADFSKDIAGAITRAGGQMAELRSITKGGVVAASLFGERSDVAARDIRQALAGTLGAKDLFAQAVLVPFLQTRGVAKDHAKVWNEIARKTPEKALRLLNEAFQQGAIKDAAKAFENSFSGVSTTLQSAVQEFLEIAGKPIFGAIIDQIKKANVFLANNKKQVQAFGRSVGKFLKSAFETAVKAFKFLSDNRSMLLTLAKALIAFKAAQGLTAAAGGVLGLVNAAKEAGGGLKALAGVVGLGRAGLVGAIAGLTFVIADLVAKKIDKAQENAITKTVETSSLQRLATQQARGRAGFFDRGEATKESQDNVKFNNARAILQKALDLGVDISKQQTAVGIGAKVGVGETRSRALARGKAFDKSSKAVINFTQQLNFAIKNFGEEFRAFKSGAVAEGQERLKIEADKAAAVAAGTAKKDKFRAPSASVGKIVINVATDDPNRFAVGLEGIFQDLVRNPTQAVSAIIEG